MEKRPGNEEFQGAKLTLASLLVKACAAGQRAQLPTRRSIGLSGVGFALASHPGYGGDEQHRTGGKEAE